MNASDDQLRNDISCLRATGVYEIGFRRHIVEENIVIIWLICEYALLAQILHDNYQAAQKRGGIWILKL